MAAIKREVYQMERFTAKPKWWGKLRHKSKLKASEYLILDVIFDRTIDWGKQSDKISISQFQDELGLSNRNVIDSLNSLKDKGLILISGQMRKINTITIKITKCEQLALSETGEKSSPDVNSQTGENFSQTGEKSSPKLVKKVHTHDTRKHYTIPFKKNTKKDSSQNSTKIENQKLGVGQIEHPQPAEQIDKPVSKPQYPPVKKYKPDKPDGLSDTVWQDLLTHRKAKKTSNTKTAWTRIFNALSDAQQATGHDLDTIVSYWLMRDWKGFNAEWYTNAHPQPNTANNQTYGGQTHAKRQHTNQGHFDRVRAEFEAKYGSDNQHTIRDVN